MSRQPSTTNRRPAALWVLLGMLLFLSVGAFYGGISLIADPTGGLLRMPPDALAGTPFGDYLIPGLILTAVLGIFPLFAAFGIVFRPNISALEGLEQRTGMHWAWTSSAAVGLALVIWMAVQGWMIGFGAAIQWAYLALGLAILAMTMVRPLRARFAVAKRPSRRIRRIRG